MPTKTDSKTRQEMAERWNVPVEVTARRKDFYRWAEENIRVTRKDALGRVRVLRPSPRQMETVWEALEERYSLLERAGIAPRLIRYPWGAQLRYKIPGLRGWFGYPKASEWAKEAAGE
jgi:hypothetical protein